MKCNKEIKENSKNDPKYMSHSHSTDELIGACSKNLNQDLFMPQLTSLNKSSKVAGYRIIRKIIPGPNSSSADIEKALAR